MRIVIANWYAQIVGGTEKYLQVLIPALRKAGHEVVLAYGDPLPAAATPIDEPERLAGWSFEELGAEALVRKIRLWAPDLVYCHGIQAPEMEHALLIGFPCVLFAHDYHGTCGSGHKCHAFPRFQPCNRTFGLMCVLYHYPRHCGALNPFEAIEVFRVQRARNRLLPLYRRVCVASRHMRKEFVRHGVAPNLVNLLPLPNTDISPVLEPPPPRTPRGRLLFLGRLIPVKGCDHVIEALPIASRLLNHSLELTVGGSGPQLEALRRKAAALGATVHFTGWMGLAQRIESIQNSDLLAVPSLWPEPFGLIGVEAGCLGLPSVAYDTGGISDWLEPGVSGELAGTPRPDNLAEAIARALIDTTHYNKLRVACWEKARLFTMDRHLEQLVPLLENAASNDV